MTDRIINLRAWEAAALAEGRATALVRVCKPQPTDGPCGEMVDFGDGFWGMNDGDLSGEYRCPFGSPGDVILGRETMYLHKHAGSRGGWLYRADNSQVSVNAADHDSVQAMREWSHKAARSHCSSTQMPRWAIRARYTNAGVRCMRVQELSTGDMWECGMPVSPDVDPVHEYAEQYDRDHGPGAWASNPWVFIARLAPCAQ